MTVRLTILQDDTKLGRRPLFALIALLVCAATGVAQAAPPYPASGTITGVSFDWSTHDERAPGSDNWPVTWSDDGHQYSSFGDGGGFGGTNSDGRVSLGVARVEGSSGAYSGFNVWGGKNPENPAQFDGKSYGMLSVGGTLYMWWGPGSNTVVYDETRMTVSTDRGATWTKSSWDFTDVDAKLVVPTILNFGQDYAGARDTYVYSYFIRKEPTGSGLGIQKGGSPATGKIDLARAPQGQLMDQSAYEFLSGFDGGGNPLWTSDALGRVPVFEDGNGVGWNMSVSYNAPLGRYLLITEHSETFKGYLGMFEAPEPWGPWTTVEYYEGPEYFGSDVSHTDTTFFWNFANKWLSGDGKDFSVVFTGIGQDDSWNSIRGAFATAGGGSTQTLTITKTGAGSGMVTTSPAAINCGSTCAATFSQGVPVSLIASSDFGSVFSGWGGDPDCADGFLTMDSDRSCSAQFDLDVSSQSGPIAYWALDEGGGSLARDAVTPPDDGWLTNMEPDADWVSGSLGPALGFDGVDEFVEVSDSGDLDLAGSDFTLAAWINPTTFGQSSQGRILDHGGGSSGAGGWTLQLMDNATVSRGLAIQINGTSMSVSDADVIALGAWQHVAVTLEEGAVSFYVDGQLQGTAFGVAAPIARSAPVRIGMRATDLNRAFDGAIDEVRVYDRALLQSEIQVLAAPCVQAQDLVLENQTISSEQVFAACNTLSTGPEVVVATGADVTLSARKKIILGNGFSVESDATFSAGLDPLAGSI